MLKVCNICHRVRTGFEKSGKVTEIDSAILQDLESFGKRGFGKILDICLGKF